MNPEYSENSESIVTPFNGEAVQLALTEARSLDPDDFRQTELEWLKKHNPRLQTVIEASFFHAVSGPESSKAQPSLFGKLFAHFAVRLAAERSGTDYQAVKLNVMLNIDAINASYSRGSTQYRGDMSYGQLTEKLLGQDVSNAINDIQNDEARLDAQAMLLILLVLPRVLENY